MYTVNSHLSVQENFISFILSTTPISALHLKDCIIKWLLKRIDECRARHHWEQSNTRKAKSFMMGTNNCANSSTKLPSRKEMAVQDIWKLSYNPQCVCVVTWQLRAACTAILPKVPSNYGLAVIKDGINFKCHFAFVWPDPLMSEFLDRTLVQVQLKRAAYIYPQHTRP